MHAHDVTDANDFRLVRLAGAAGLGRRRGHLRDLPRPLRPLRRGRRRGRCRRGRCPPTGTTPVDRPRRGDAAAAVTAATSTGSSSHLDHIASLGVNTVYLTPFFPAESNHRYNASSFDEVDPLLGGDKALARLAQEVHARGWRLIGDLTANHSGDTHPWFRRARRTAAPPERDFFYFAGRRQRLRGLARRAARCRSSGTARGAAPPAPRRPGLRGRRWLRPPYDLDGWRVDVANMTGRLGADDFNPSVARPARDLAARRAGRAAHRRALPRRVRRSGRRRLARAR